MLKYLVVLTAALVMLAAASEAQARALVTLDGALLTSQKLQEKLDLRILHPRELT